MSAQEHPAAILRRAAKKMREDAGNATGGPWGHMCLGSEGCLVLKAHGTIRERGKARVARFGQKDWQADHADASYVASMSPLVGLALADLLEREAALIDAQAFPQSDPAAERYPLAVALAYLGEPAAEGAER